MRGKKNSSMLDEFLKERKQILQTSPAREVIWTVAGIYHRLWLNIQRMLRTTTKRPHVSLPTYSVRRNQPNSVPLIHIPTQE